MSVPKKVRKNVLSTRFRVFENKQVQEKNILKLQEDLECSKKSIQEKSVLKTKKI